MRWSLLPLLALAAWCSPRAAVCRAESGERTIALVELYTSARCTACPVAERWLSDVARRFSLGRVVPVWLRFDDWEYSGARAADVAERVSQREGKLALLQRTSLLHSPQVLLGGQEFSEWRDAAAFGVALDRINARPAVAILRLAIRSIVPPRLAVEVHGRILGARGGGDDDEIYLAALARGENGYMLRQWVGPIRPGVQGAIAASRDLLLPPGARAGDSAVAAFVQSRRSREVLQALLLPACSP